MLEAEGWKFTIGNGVVWFQSPRMKDSFGLNADLDKISISDIFKRESQCVLLEWEEKILSDFDENVLQKLAEQYKILIDKGIEPPKTQRISFDINFP